jgi:ketosteroid isomerase-like protein
MRRLVLLAFLASCRPAAAPAPDADPRALEAQFARSAEAWNRGDLDSFIADYAADSLTTFVSGGHVQRGFAWIRDHYAPAFALGAARDSLRFEEFAARPLGQGRALVTARFVLTRAGRVSSSGPFTLVMEYRPEGWKILHDHTSSDPH